MTVAVLFVRRDSIYKQLPDVDCWDEDRDAQLFAGPGPIVAHPPCRGWGRLRQFSYASDDEKLLALWAIKQAREYGGVVEHPATSTLWQELGLSDGWKDPYGFVWPVFQQCFGHRAQKATRLYICGMDSYHELPDMPITLGRATHCVRPTKSYPRLPSITKPEREHTPIEFAKWLVEMARRCK